MRAAREEPLDSHEISHLAYLLHRCIKNGQQDTECLKSFGIGNLRVSTSGASMSDACKRGRDDFRDLYTDTEGEGPSPSVFSEVDGQASSVGEGSAWSVVNTEKGTIDYYAPVLNLNMFLSRNPKPSPEVALPGGVLSVADWGTSLFVLPKLKDCNYSFTELVEKAWGDRDLCSYVSWLTTKYATERAVPGKASDFAQFVRATGVKPSVRLEILSNGRQKKSP
jgi:hypothetical protein